MPDAQTIFTLFYGIYFAVTTTLTGKFQPFDTPSMWKGKPSAWFRFGVSFLLLNVVPLLYFVTVFHWLEDIKSFSPDFGSMFMLLVLSLAGFGFYRIYFGTMLIKIGNRHLFYRDELPKPVIQELDQRDDSHRDWLAHLAPGILWVVLALIAGYFWIYVWSR